MAAPKGSKNAKGNKGGGRKSAYQEKLDADFVHKLFLNKHSWKEIEKEIESGKFSVKTVMIKKLLEGNTRLLEALMRKIFPDLTAVEHKGDTIKTLAEFLNGKEKK